MQKPSYAKLDVLVADPSPHMSGLVSSMLRHLKVHGVVEASTSHLALSALQLKKFGVIFVDDELAPLDGVAFTRLVRQTADGINRDTPVVMMSSQPSATRIAEARDAGITEFLRKPFAGNHIVTRLDSILGAPRPFIANAAYVGPDRRRRQASPPGEERRLSADSEAQTPAGADADPVDDSAISSQR